MKLTLVNICTLSDEFLQVNVARMVGRDPWWKCKNHSEVSGPECPWCGSEATREDCPDYCNDLNAVAEAEQALLKTETENVAYADRLFDVICRDTGIEIIDMSNLTVAQTIRASARQRLEALVLSKQCA